MSLLWQQCAGTLLWECHLHSSGSALYTFCVSLINSYNNTKDFFVPFIVQLSSNNLYILSQSNVKYYELKRKWFLSMNTKIVQISTREMIICSLCFSLTRIHFFFCSEASAMTMQSLASFTCHTKEILPVLCVPQPNLLCHHRHSHIYIPVKMARNYGHVF